MSGTKTNSEAHKRARKTYRDKTSSKTVTFNLETKADALAFAAAQDLDNFSAWVKKHLLEEAKRRNIKINLKQNQ